MSTIRLGTTADGTLQFGVPALIGQTSFPLASDPPLPPVPPTPPALREPIVTVTRFESPAVQSGLITANGWRFEFEDGHNPGFKVKLETRNGSIYATLINPAGEASTGAFRRVI